MAGQIPAGSIGKYRLQRLPIGLSSGVGSAHHLGELLFDREARKSRLHPTDRIDKRRGSRLGRASRSWGTVVSEYARARRLWSIGGLFADFDLVFDLSHPYSVLPLCSFVAYLGSLSAAVNRCELAIRSLR
jgi:hypothetical protein